MTFGIDDAIAAVAGIITKYIPDTAAKDAAKAEIAEKMLSIAAASDQAQADINKVEAAGNFFESGWRPYIGWTCGLAFSGHYVWTPSFLFLRSCWQGICMIPSYDMAEINSVLYLLLGFGAYRTVDKGIGVVMKSLK